MQLECYAFSDVGKKREKNEDSYLLNESCGLFMVADGMGGHLGGEYASRLAVNTVEEAIESLERDPNMTLQNEMEVKPGDYKAWLYYSIQAASNKVFEKAKANPSLYGMGTTAVALLFRGNRVYWANVGDSRGYRIRGGKIEQLTEDHSLVEEQLRAGMITREEIRDHRLKNIITRSVGFQQNVEVDVESRLVKPGDLFILCTDGLSNLVRDEDMKDIAAHHPLKEACRQLVDIANAKGGEDNITVVMIKVLTLETSPEEETTVQVS